MTTPDAETIARIIEQCPECSRQPEWIAKCLKEIESIEWDIHKLNREEAEAKLAWEGKSKYIQEKRVKVQERCPHTSVKCNEGYEFRNYECNICGLESYQPIASRTFNQESKSSA